MTKEAMVYTLPVEKIIVPEDRIRQIFKRAAMQGFVFSLKKFGQLQPGICRKEEDKYILVAGERRLRGCEEAGIPFKFELSSEVDPLRIREIELEENIQREDIDFKEEVAALKELYGIKQTQFGISTSGAPGGYRIEDFAEYSDRSEGIISEDLELATFLEIDEVRNAKNKTEAKKVIKRIKEEFRTSKALKEAREGPQPPEVELDEDASESARQAVRAAELREKVEFFGERIHLGRMEEILPTHPDSCYDVVCFDPPWGVDFDKVKKETGSTRNYEDDEAFVRENFPKWLKILYQKMSENSHLYLFFGISRYPFIYEELEKVGFSTNGIPLIWFKQGAHRTRNPDVWPGRSYEPIVYARKGSKILIQKGAPDVIITPTPTPTIKGTHPSAKHPMIYIELLKRSCSPGDKLLDPMCGSGMMAVAAETLRHTHQLDWQMIEVEETFQELSLFNVIKGYHYLTNIDTVSPEYRTDPVEERLPYYICTECGASGAVANLPIRKKDGRKVCKECQSSIMLYGEDVPEDYKKIDYRRPGGPEIWKAHWKKYPENQEGMLAWKKLHEADI